MEAEINSHRSGDDFDPMLLAVISHRLDAIVREMGNALLRGARSAVVASHDFSCSISSSEDELLASADGLPGHICGGHRKSRAMRQLHPDYAPGDAFLHNDPYLGNTHAADHTILVPVFLEDEHLFTVSVMAHQADCGNATPTTYVPFALDVYNEGALIFPCVRIQQNYRDVMDIIRMCERRIRVPEVWYGDYLAMVGGARVGERRLIELVRQYGRETLLDFKVAWLDYSERMMISAIRDLPSGTIRAQSVHDPIPGFPDGIPVNVAVNVNAECARVTIDLRENIDSQPIGLNQSEACAYGNAMIGLFNVLDRDVPHNSGSFRRVDIQMRDNCVVGATQHPFSCSMATTNLGDRIVNAVQSAFARVNNHIGIAESGVGMGPGAATVSGLDPRRKNHPYQNQILMLCNGGAASAFSDGWTNFGVPVVAGQLMRDSVEVDELKYPVIFKRVKQICDSGGAGKYRGALAAEITYGPRLSGMEVIYPLDGAINPPKGVQGGLSGHAPYSLKLDANGEETLLPHNNHQALEVGEFIVGRGCGGGGYGDPFERDVDLVLHDVNEGWVSAKMAEELYGVVTRIHPETRVFLCDEQATAHNRASAVAPRKSD